MAEEPLVEASQVPVLAFLLYRSHGSVSAFALPVLAVTPELFRAETGVSPFVWRCVGAERLADAVPITPSPWDPRPILN